MCEILVNIKNTQHFHFFFNKIQNGVKYVIISMIKLINNRNEIKNNTKLEIGRPVDSRCE